jgi:hypothetical protein
MPPTRFSGNLSAACASELSTPLKLEKTCIHRQNLGSTCLQAAFRRDSGTFSWPLRCVSLKAVFSIQLEQ